MWSLQHYVSNTVYGSVQVCSSGGVYSTVYIILSIIGHRWVAVVESTEPTVSITLSMAVYRCAAHVESTVL